MLGTIALGLQFQRMTEGLRDSRYRENSAYRDIEEVGDGILYQISNEAKAFLSGDAIDDGAVQRLVDSLERSSIRMREVVERHRPAMNVATLEACENLLYELRWQLNERATRGRDELDPSEAVFGDAASVLHLLADVFVQYCDEPDNPNSIPCGYALETREVSAAITEEIDRRFPDEFATSEVLIELDD